MDEAARRINEPEPEAELEPEPESELEPEPEPELLSAARGFFRFVGWGATVALVVVLAMFGALVVNRHFRDGPPDVAGISRSQPVVTADRAVASEISATLRTLAPADASGLVPGPMAVADYCYSGPSDSFGSSWAPTGCVRTVEAYFFSDDPSSQHVQAWEAALRSSGWRATGDMSGGSSGYLRVSDVSSVLLGQPLYLTFDWSPRTRATDLTDGSAATAPEYQPGTIVVWNQKTTAPPDAAESAAFSRYRFVARVTVTGRYYDSAAGAAPAPVATGDGGRGQCVTGSGTCN